jgi:hypothetical protein
MSFDPIDPQKRKRRETRFGFPACLLLLPFTKGEGYKINISFVPKHIHDRHPSVAPFLAKLSIVTNPLDKKRRLDMTPEDNPLFSHGIRSRILIPPTCK